MEQVTEKINELRVGDGDVSEKVEPKKTDVEAKETVTVKEVDGEEGDEDESEEEEEKEGEEVGDEKTDDKNDKNDKSDISVPRTLEIGFTVPHNDEYTSPYIELGSRFQKSYDRCLDLDEIVLPSSAITKDTDDNKCVTLWLDYPLDDEYSFKIYPEDVNKGFTRGHLIREIKRTYDKLYAEEEETSSLPVENIPGMLNRATTDGNYGVWGHALDDLVLHTISYDLDENEIWLGIDS